MPAQTPHENIGDKGQALAPQSIGAGASVNGPRIINPARWGKYLTIFLNLPAMTGVTAFSARLEGSNDGGATWSPVKQNDGITDLAFSGAAFLPGGAYVNNVAMGTIDVSRGKYKDYRLGAVTPTTAAAVVSATYVVFAPGSWPNSLMVDEFLNKFLPTGS